MEHFIKKNHKTIRTAHLIVLDTSNGSFFDGLFQEKDPFNMVEDKLMFTTSTNNNTQSHPENMDIIAIASLNVIAFIGITSFHGNWIITKRE